MVLGLWVKVLDLMLGGGGVRTANSVNIMLCS